MNGGERRRDKPESKSEDKRMKGTERPERKSERPIRNQEEFEKKSTKTSKSKDCAGDH